MRGVGKDVLRVEIFITKMRKEKHCDEPLRGFYSWPESCLFAIDLKVHLHIMSYNCCVRD